MNILFRWSAIIPLLAWGLFFSGVIDNNTFLQVVTGVMLMLSVMAAIQHSEIIAHAVGEPYGTIILAVAVTVIEAGIIVSLMISGGQDALSVARDTVFSATMLILNGIIGLCLFIGGIKFYEQNFSKHSAIIALVSLVSIVVLALVFPTFSTSVQGPYYSTAQLIFVSFVCLIIYLSFLLAQTTTHKEYFSPAAENEESHEHKISKQELAVRLVLLLVSLGIVVLLAKALSPTIEKMVVSYNLPKTLVGVIIAATILLPEGISAIIAARNNKLQKSLNLALGSALASIGLTIPTVAIVSIALKMDLILGLDYKSMILLGLSVFTVMLSLVSGRTNTIYGVVLLVNLVAFIFLIIHP